MSGPTKYDKDTGLLALPTPAKGLREIGSARRQSRGLDRLPVHPTGSRVLNLGKRKTLATGPGEPPPGFIGQWNSKTEWMVYWAFMRLTEPDRDPRIGPFTGGQYFQYQKSEEGGRVPGGSVTDFAISTPTGWIGVRVETERWHVFTDAATQMKDQYIADHLKTMQGVIRIWDQYFVGDTTGQQVCRVCALALQRIELPNPIRMGIAERVRP